MNGELHLIDYSQKLPGGTIDRSVEFFVHDGEMYCRTEGETYPFDEFPDWLLEIVQADMDKNPEKIGYLVEWGLLTDDGQMRQYLFCLYGGHDDNPDIDEEGNMQPSEYVDCGLRCGKCKFEGKICNSLELPHGRLSSQEIKTIMLIGKNALDKEIADEIYVSMGTVRYYKDEILRKAGMANERKTALVGLAYKLGLVK